MSHAEAAVAPQRGALYEVFAAALRLGLTSFGGPIAHLGYFREEYVLRRKWLDDKTYADLVALCQFLPGPASSQVGISVGIARAGLAGGVAAWLGFTLPSAVALVLFAYGISAVGAPTEAGWLHGLKIVAVAVVAQAVWGMAQAFSVGRERATLTIAVAIAVLAWQSAASQILAIAAAGVIGRFSLPPLGPGGDSSVEFRVGRRLAFGAWICFAALLLALPLARQISGNETIAVFDSFFRTGSLVFGGGHVVLPLLQAEVVEPGWVSTEEFVAGYGATQAVPGPLFTFAAYLGAVMNGWTGALLTLTAVFLPSFLLITGALPFWDWLRRNGSFQSAMSGINAAVVGLLLAALYQPVWTSAIHSASDFAVALAAFGALALWKLPPWLVVLLTALASALVARLA